MEEEMEAKEKIETENGFWNSKANHFMALAQGHSI